MLFADLHLHTDYDLIEDKWHGCTPPEMAEAIVESGLDVAAITEHGRVSANYFDTQSCVRKLIEDTGRNILLLPGFEVPLIIGQTRVHIGYIFEDDLKHGHLPSVLRSPCNIRELAHFKWNNCGMTILYHPGRRLNGSTAKEKEVEGLIESGLVDAVEVINGTILANGHNGHDPEVNKKAFEIVSKSRQRGNRIALVGSSDAHKPDLIGSAVTAFDGRDPSSIFRAVRSGLTKAVAVDPRVIGKLRGIFENDDEGKYGKMRQHIYYLNANDNRLNRFDGKRKRRDS